ncbi:MAG: hypothetical protein BWK76_23615 [Desulfobulbaceae bacterium A2]|nr:MAG: hypothetical protein BWK76_23615 [Desulfobulbaceae bacterium A2]
MSDTTQKLAKALADGPHNLNGLEFLQRIADGRLPPPSFAVLLDIRPVEADKGRAVFAAVPDTRFYNPLGTVHGGFAATMLDTCMGCAVHTRLKAGQSYTTLDLVVHYVRRISAASGELRAEGTVLHLGRTTASASGRLIDARGRLLAHATASCQIFSTPSEH